MNRRITRTHRALRIAALVMSIALIFGSMAVFNADSEGDGTGVITGYSNPTGEPGDDNNGGDTDAGDLNAGDPNAGDPDAGDLNAGDPDAGDLNAGDPNAGDPDAGDPDAGDPNAGDPDAGNPNAGNPNAGDPNAGDPDAGDLNAGDPNAGDDPAPVPASCDFCGEELNEYDICANGCHTHSGEGTMCQGCETCGGCVCVINNNCYKTADTQCTPCACFTIELRNALLSTSLTVEEAQEMVAGNDSFEVDLGKAIVLATADGKMTLDAAMADGATITSMTVTAKPIIYNYYPLQPLHRNGKLVPCFTFTNVCVEGATGAEGKNHVPVQVKMTISYKGVTKDVTFIYNVNITNAKYIEAVNVTLGRENLELLVGNSAFVEYLVKLAEGYTGGWHIIDEQCSDDSIIDYTVTVVGNEIHVKVTGLKAGTATLKLTVGEGETEKDSYENKIERTITVKVVKEKVPKGAVLLSKSTIKEDDKVVLDATGWIDGTTVANSKRCYAPASWKVDGKSGKWSLPKSMDDSDAEKYLLPDDVTISGLSVGKHSVVVTFQCYERDKNGVWKPVAGDTITGSAALTVTADTSKPSDGTPDKEDGNTTGGGTTGGGTTGGGNTGGGTTGGTPHTGDITVRDNTGVNIAGTLMLIGGLGILAALVGERIYRELMARKRQAKAIRR